MNVDISCEELQYQKKKKWAAIRGYVCGSIVFTFDPNETSKDSQLDWFVKTVKI